ncbi:MAG: OmpA family protein [Lysobacterales bacterium]|nr:MAG: OmpA family protein [Xanthomonadales bacterium]
MLRLRSCAAAGVIYAGAGWLKPPHHNDECFFTGDPPIMRFMHASFLKTGSIFGLIAALAFLATGCVQPASVAPPAGTQTACGFVNTAETNNTATGALIGAVAGAALGAATGHSKGKRALIGAAGGAVVGGAIGAYMDNKEQALRQQLAGTGVIVSRSGNIVILTFPEGITFPVGKSTLSSGGRSALGRIAPTLASADRTRIGVCGHTDNTGSRELNERLSYDRATVVANTLSGFGVPSGRMIVRGFAYDMPIASNATPEGRARNRRVEIVLEPVN